MARNRGSPLEDGAQARLLAAEERTPLLLREPIVRRYVIHNL